MAQKMNTIPANQLQVLILTYNEEDNIQRTIEKLKWIERIVLVDSFSTDNTISILKTYPNTEVHFRKFDSFAEQCNYGLSLLTSEWVLSMDADYVLPDDFIEETKKILANKEFSADAYAASFRFLVFGKKIADNNTTPRIVLFRTLKGTYYNDGHAHRLNINGNTGVFKSRILHDDRKSLTRWLNNQSVYSIQECEKLMSLPSGDLSFTSRIRKTKLLAPFIVFFYCLFVKGLILDGWRGWYYTLQRTLVEILFALRLIEHDHLQP